MSGKVCILLSTLGTTLREIQILECNLHSLRVGVINSMFPYKSKIYKSIRK